MVSVFISIIIELLVPAGNIKKYVKVIISIYIIFVILNPIVSNIDNINLEEFFEVELNSSKTNEFDSYEIAEVYAVTIESKIKEKYNSVQKVDVIFSSDLEDIEKIEIYVKGSVDEAKIKAFVTNMYIVEEKIISFVYV